MMQMDCDRPRMRKRYASHWQRIRGYVRPSLSPGYRDCVAFVMVGEGLIRFIDGALFATPAMDYLPARIWGLFELLIGLLLFATRGCQARAGLRGRIIASIGCGFLVAMAYTLFSTSAASAVLHGSLAALFAPEAQVHECE